MNKLEMQYHHCLHMHGESKSTLYSTSEAICHAQSFQDFSDKFKLGYNFSLDDYQDAPLELANQGHLIVKKLGVNDITIFYIPRRITERQLTWMEYNKMDFLNKNLVGAYSLTFEEEPEQISGITDIVNEIRKKYKRYQKEVDENVGKKI